jgi:hypothetical protein
MAKRLVLFHRSLKNLIRLEAFGLVTWQESLVGNGGSDQ